MRQALSVSLSFGACFLLTACATIPNETPCQRAQRVALTAHALANAGAVAGLDPVVVGKLEAAANIAGNAAVGVCGAR